MLSCCLTLQALLGCTRSGQEHRNIQKLKALPGRCIVLIFHGFNLAVFLNFVEIISRMHTLLILLNCRHPNFRWNNFANDLKFLEIRKIKDLWNISAIRYTLGTITHDPPPPPSPLLHSLTHSQVDTIEGVLIFRFMAPVCFVNAAVFRTRLEMECDLHKKQAPGGEEKGFLQKMLPPVS